MTVHICYGPPLAEVSRTPHGTIRWCYHCRARRPFELVVLAPTEPSYYGPSPHIECTTCHTHDGDLFPGRYREWEES